MCLNQELKRVRIALAVDSRGEWSSAGWSQADDDTLMDLAVESLMDGEARFWVEVDVPVPMATVLQGRISRG